MKTFDLAVLSAADSYKLLRNVVTPRPIALVTTVDPAGVVNAAPFSFFNAIAFDPCMVVLGLEARPDGTPKDTSRNIRLTREFVVNIVDHAAAEKMNLCATPLSEIVVGEVCAIAIRDDVVDVENLHVDAGKLDTIGRLGANLYSTSRDRFALDRPDGR